MTTRSNYSNQVINRLIQDGLCATAKDYGNDKIQTDKGNVFVKIGTGGARANVSLLKYEAMGLERMARSTTILRVPKPWLVGSLDNGEGFIVMDCIEFGNNRANNVQHKLGEGLAEMHLAEPEHKFFGFPMDGCCGACPQLNNVECLPMSWPDFWNKFRLGHQLQMIHDSYPTDREIQQNGAQLMGSLKEICFSDLIIEDIKPSLLHGDLWSGNFSSDTAGIPVIFDPAPYYGHNEADLGIAHMFGGFDKSFWDAYHSKLPKTEKYQKRALLYELHHHLNHYNIFGEGYRSGALILIKKLLK